MAEPLFGQVAIIGGGLIGSSLLRALRVGGVAERLLLAEADAAVRARAAELGLADDYTASADQAGTCDLAILCAPVGANAAIAAALGPVLKPGAIVSDVGSVKAAVIRDLRPYLPDHAHLVPAHPVAGTEHSGPDAGFADLFRGRWCILTPPEGTDTAAVARMRALWERIGSNVEIMEAERHDLVLAVTSHIPHLIAYTIVGTASDLEAVTENEVIKFAAGGFRDFTRIAASDPTMWRDVFLNNREAVLEVLGRFTEDLALLRRNIRWGEGEPLHDLFSRTRAIRKGVEEANQA